MKGRPFHVWAQSRAAGKDFERLQGVDGAIGGFRCAPWSLAQIFPPEGRSREQERTLAIEELRGVARNVCSARPQRIIWESSADILDSPEWWERMKAGESCHAPLDGVVRNVFGRATTLVTNMVNQFLD